MKYFIRGQKSKLADIFAATNFQVGLNIGSTSPVTTFDISCFGVDEQGKLSDDRYFIFFNQKQSPCNSIQSLGSQGPDKEVFQVNLSGLPATIKKLVFTITIENEGTMSQVTEGWLRLLDQNQEFAKFAFAGGDFKDEKAIIVGEIYLKDVWRFAAVGQGFNGGLSALLKYFGGEEIEESAPPAPSQTIMPPPPTPFTPPPPPTPFSASPPAPPSVSLSKVVLDKPNQSHKVSLNKGGANELITVRAQWTDNGDGIAGNDDLDLRVGLLLPNGQMGMIHADFLGSLTQFPFIQHMGDVKEPGEEIAKVRADISQLIGGRVGLVFSVYSAVQNGAVSVASLKPKMRLEYGNQVVECNFDFSQLKQSQSGFFSKFSSPQNDDIYIYTYVIGLAIVDGQSIEIKPSGMVSAPHSEATPRLSWALNGDVNLAIDGNPVFKQS
jgi:tellurite resistance protein TerA